MAPMTKMRILMPMPQGRMQRAIAAHERAGCGSRYGLRIDKIRESTEPQRRIAAGRDNVGSHERVEFFAIVIAGGGPGKFADGRMNIDFVEAVRQMANESREALPGHSSRPPQPEDVIGYQ